MTAAAAIPASDGGRLPAPLRPLGEDRWLELERRRTRQLSGTMLAILAISVVSHALVLALVVLHAAPSGPPPHEAIAVEVVRTVPEAAAHPPAAAKPPEARQQPTTSPPTQAKPVPPTPVAQNAAPQQPAPPRQADDLKALQDELNRLKAEQAALKGEQEAEAARDAAAQARRPAPPRSLRGALGGLGPLPQSFQAVALPSETAGEGEAVDYSALVFSQLAKAKGVGRRMGRPGTAGVRFSIDARGNLLDVALVATSGIDALDEEALGVVRKAAPFPAPPPGAQRDFTANVSFVADGAAP